MAKLSVYIETTVISYLVAKPSSQTLAANRQRITRAWWDQRSRHVLLVSPEVLREASEGDERYASRRIEALAAASMLEPHDAVGRLADVLLAAAVLPVKARSDAIHLSFASFYAVDALVTWNLRHLANPASLRRARDIIMGAGYRMPEVCSPEQLLAIGD